MKSSQPNIHGKPDSAMMLSSPESTLNGRGIHHVSRGPQSGHCRCHYFSDDECMSMVRIENGRKVVGSDNRLWHIMPLCSPDYSASEDERLNSKWRKCAGKEPCAGSGNRQAFH